MACDDAYNCIVWLWLVFSNKSIMKTLKVERVSAFNINILFAMAMLPGIAVVATIYFL
jgi:hypothetical protein